MNDHPVAELAHKVFEKPVAIPFQQGVFDAIATGCNVVLQAPTGSGKTFAALTPFILGIWGGEKRPARKLIYSLPLRVLAGSLRREYEALLRMHYPDLHFTNQYGGATEDRYLDGGEDYWKPVNDQDRKDPGVHHAIFTTIDQTLSGFIGVPVGVSNRQANTLYGSILSGALVFDEFHLLKADNDERGWSFGTALHLLGKTPWPFLVMTATMSTALRQRLCEHFKAKEITVGPEDLPYICSQFETVKHLVVEHEPLDGYKLSDRLGNRTLIICNTVARAQQIYDDLCCALAKRNDAPECLLLHSRFLPQHRADKERLVTRWFRESSATRAVLVATQVVEAGLNISCDVMHTEVSPIDSFLQRIGRAARFGHEREATVHVYPLEDMTRTRPYKRQTTVDTLAALRQHQYTHGDLHYENLQGLIDPILEKTQQEDFERYWKQQQEFDRRIHEVRWQVDRKANRELVRDINNAEVIIADHTTMDESPWAYPAVSISRGTLWGYQKEGGEVYGISEAEDETTMGRARRKLISFERLGPDDSLPTPRVVIPPSQAFYSREIGLRLGKPGTYTFLPEPGGDPAPEWSDYQEEPYHLHIQRLYQQDAVRQASLDALYRLRWKNEDERVVRVRYPEKVVDLIIWAHDLAKLTDGWQRAHGDHNPPLAHGGRIHIPPPHAVESARIAEELLVHVLIEYLGEDYDVVDAALMAICTHHAPKYDRPSREQGLKPYRVSPHRIAYLREQLPSIGTEMGDVIAACWKDLDWSYNNEPLHLPDHTLRAADPVYALLVYMLRRSDGLATSLASKPPENGNPEKTGTPAASESPASTTRIISRFI